MSRRRQTRRKVNPRAPDAAQQLASLLGKRWDRFVVELECGRKRATEPAVHDLRVATRRLIAVMATVDALLPAARLRKTIRQLRRHLRSFNDLRDVQVQLVTLRPLRRRFPILRGYEAMLKRRHASLVQKARAEISSMRREEIMRPITDAGEAIFAFFGNRAAQRAAGAILVGSAASAFTKVLQRRSELSGVDPRTIHRMRVAFKKFRYTIELARPLLPWAGEAHSNAMDTFQTTMGEIQDLRVLAAGLRRFALQRPRGRTTSLLAVFRYLSEMRKGRIDEFLHGADEVQRFWK